jgi:hypothetical protein
MASLGFGLDLSHMDVKSALQALEAYPGTILASHANAARLLKNPDTNRHLPDEVIRGLIERDGVIGVVPYNRFLWPVGAGATHRRQLAPWWRIDPARWLGRPHGHRHRFRRWFRPAVGHRAGYHRRPAGWRCCRKGAAAISAIFGQNWLNQWRGF